MGGRHAKPKASESSGTHEKPEKTSAEQKEEVPLPGELVASPKFRGKMPGVPDSRVRT